jgi:hypothetical protein
MAKKENDKKASAKQQCSLFDEDDDWKVFFEIAQRALLFRHRPTEKMLQQIADALDAICGAPRKHQDKEWSRFEQANWLMDEVTIHHPWDEWEGAAGLR